MNPKQIGVLIVVIGIIAAVQFGMSFQGKARDIDIQAEAAIAEEKSLHTQLDAERGTLADLQRQSKELLSFVAKWQPYYAVIEEKQAAETGISMKVREAGMLNLSQRYQQVPHKINNKENASLPVLVRATLVFDDNYSTLLNWFGNMEKIKPTMRVGKIALSKGSRGEDLRMELVLEVPLRKAKPKT